jgi:hypothetical protein
LVVPFELVKRRLSAKIILMSGLRGSIVRYSLRLIRDGEARHNQQNYWLKQFDSKYDQHGFLK